MGKGKYSKVLVCGDVIYWYEYDKPPTKTADKKLADDFDPFDYDDYKIDEDYFKECRKEERRSQTLRDGSNTLRRLALMNFKPETSTFLTLTFREHVTDIDYADNEFKNFMKRLRYRYKGSKIHYLAVRELTKRKRWHFHLLVDTRLNMAELPSGYGRYKGEDGKTYNNKVAHQYELEHVFKKEDELADIWGHGWVDVKPLYGEVDNVGAYLSKYMTKSIALELYEGKKFYLPSQGLERPIPIVGDEADELIEMLSLKEQKEVFSNSYTTEYQGNCNFKEINLKRSLVLL